MAICELSIKETYVSNWSTWEAIREIIQNALDENDRGFPLEIKYKDGVLFISNIGANMTVASLILGEGDKAGNKELRGEHSEGLALALLAGIRSKLNIRVKTQDEVWTPAIKFSERYGTKVLIVQTRKLRKRGLGVTVEIKIEKEEWEKWKLNFLYFQSIPDKERIDVKDGTILLGKQFKGMLFGKGIFVERRHDFLHGYDIKDARLDRERRLFKDFDLKWTIGSMYSSAAYSAPKEIAKTVYPLLKRGKGEANSFMAYNTGNSLKKAVAEEFREEHGKKAIVVTDIKESMEAEYHGHKGIVVSGSLKEVIQNEVSTLAKIKHELKNAVQNLYSWSDLSPQEQASLTQACSLFQSALEYLADKENLCKDLGVSSVWSTYDRDKIGDILDNVNIVKFGDSSTRGMMNNKTGKVMISRSELSHSMRCLTVLIHERAHGFFNSCDGEIIHTLAIQECWCVVMYVNSMLKE